jgi:hypothetical protein
MGRPIRHSFLYSRYRKRSYRGNREKWRYPTRQGRLKKVGNAAMAPHMCCRQPLHGKPGPAKCGGGHIVTGYSVVFCFAGIAIKSFFLVLNKLGTLFRRTKLELTFIKDKI